MNIAGRNLLSLTVYHLRRVVRLVTGGVVIDEITQNPDGSVTVIGGGGNPGETIIVTFPDGSTGTGIVGPGGGWQVTSPDPVEPVPGPEDLIVDQVPTPEQPDVPEVGGTGPGEGGGTVVDGSGGDPGDEVEVTLPGGGSGTGEVDENGDWEVEIPEEPYDPDTDPGDIGVIITPKPGEPIIDDITQNPDGSVTVGGGGANPGDQITVTFPDGSTGTGTADGNGDWEVTSPGPVEPVPGEEDLIVDAKPDPMEGSITAPDAIYMEVAGYEFVEVNADGEYISWEQMVDAGPVVTGIADTPIDSGFVAYDGGYLLDVIRVGGNYIVEFNNNYKIFDHSSNIANATVVPKNYMAGRAFSLFKTKNSAYYLKKDAFSNILTRYDGVDVGLNVAVDNAYLPLMVAAGDKDWLVSVAGSYLIDPSNLSVQAAPLINDLLFTAVDGYYSDGDSIFITGTEQSSGNRVTCVFNSSLQEIARLPVSGALVGGSKYVYLKSGQSFSRINVGTLEVDLEGNLADVSPSVGKPRYGVSIGDFAIIDGGSTSNFNVTYDGGITWSTVSLGNPVFVGMDLEGNELIIGSDSVARAYSYARYPLVLQ